ncbi:MAG TPA: flagellin, partial [Hyphomonadaceae bacterium]|nr:flagellin [Hyphomonadaceae bacterium]
AANTLSTSSAATTVSSTIDTALETLNRQMATMGSQAKALDIQNEFLGKLSDTIEQGVSNLVDADLAKESARLQSLQIKQQLGAQALSIANQAPSLVLSFFR